MPREDTEPVPKPAIEKTEVRSALGSDNPFDGGDSTSVRPITSDTDPLIGVEAGEYRILSALGVGSMGLVYKGAHQTTGRIVAIKVLKRALIADPSQARRFLDEARAVAACNHPGIIDVFSVGQLASDEPYLVMEFLEGEPLDAKLAREKRLPVDAVLELGVAIAAALQAAHEVGVIHRDIKPPNIFIVQRRDGTRFPKLIDFGLAQRVQGGERHEQTSIGGTPLYLAPEQARRQPITPQADLYSFGCVLFELLSGKPPFTEGNLHALLDQHASLAPVPLRALVPDVPRPLEQLVLSMLAKAPDDRPGSAAEVRSALEGARAGRVGLAAGNAPRSLGPPVDEKTTVSFVHQPGATDGGAPTAFDLQPLQARPVRPRSGETPALDRRADKPGTSPPRQRTGEQRVVGPSADEPRTRRRTGEQRTLDTGADDALEPRAGARRPTGEQRTLDTGADGGAPAPAVASKERRGRASLTGVPVAPPPPQTRLVPLVIAAAIVVVLLAIAIVVKVTRVAPAEPAPPPKAVARPKPPEKPAAPPPSEGAVEAPPVETTPVEAPSPPKEPEVTTRQVLDKHKQLGARIASLPKANRVRAQRQLKDLKSCLEPPKACLQQLEKLERKWFKR